MGSRPPPVEVDDADDAPVRRDHASSAVRVVYGLLPTTPRARLAFLNALDDAAYARIAGRFPGFIPPHRRTSRAWRPRLAWRSSPANQNAAAGARVP